MNRRDPEARMSVLGHLREARRRVLWALVGVVAGAIGGWFLVDPVMDFMLAPLHEIAGPKTQINFQTIGAAFDLKLQISIWLGVLISSPWWIFQILAFVAPGLKRREKRWLALFGVAGIALFAAGAACGVWVAPKAVSILQSFVPDGAYSLILASSYVTFYMRLVIAFGISFLAPEVLVMLGALGLVSAKTMLKGWRWATMIAFIFAGVANPLPSPWPMVVQALILLGLYFLAVLITWLLQRGRRPVVESGEKKIDYKEKNV